MAANVIRHLENRLFEIKLFKVLLELINKLKRKKNK